MENENSYTFVRSSWSDNSHTSWIYFKGFKK